jgi:cytochrome c peroxidase
MHAASTQHCWRLSHSIVAVLVALRIIHLNLAASAVQAQTPHSPSVPFVQGPNGPDFTVLNDGAGLIKSRKSAVALGKALFWDQQAGSDGNACASCHCGAAGTNTTGLIVPLGLSDCDAPIGSAPRQACDTRGQNVTNDDLAALERFLKSLTDLRVQ